MVGVQEEDCYNYCDFPDHSGPTAPRLKECIHRFKVHMNRYAGPKIRARIEYEFAWEYAEKETKEPLPRKSFEGGMPGIPTSFMILTLSKENKVDFSQFT